MLSGLRLLWLPPPAVMALTGGLMWLTRWLAEPSSSPWAPWLALPPLAAGLLLMGLAVHALRRAGTTVLPFDPQQASRLVTEGVFGCSRNPIYLGDLLLLLAWGAWLGYWPAFAWLAGFVVYMNRVQIAAEEAALAGRFGAAYQAYRARVRRWL
jgi:protein-S-isoprenylcysteine O-methyltransferase Ste14